MKYKAKEYSFAVARVGEIPRTSHQNEKKHLTRGAEVREFAPPYKASGTEAAEQCFEPIAHECEAKGKTEA